MTSRELIEKYALQNAIFYEGKANPGAVLGKVLAENPALRANAAEVKKEVEQIIKEINKLPLAEQKKKLEKSHPELLERKEKEQKGLPPLPDAIEGKVVMRMAPFPSGPLHIGNARMAMLNDEYTRRYKGKLLLVIDDTAGSEEKMPLKEAYDLIPEGLRTIGVHFHETLYKSDRMEIYYKYAEELLQKGHAYVCECDAETLRANRAAGMECRHRGYSPYENIQKWRDMLSGKYKEGQVIVRIKTDMRHPDPAFRDRGLLRISERPHPRVGTRYKVWPMLEFSWAIDDVLLDITHIVRGKDLEMEGQMEKFIWDLMGWKGPHIILHGIIKLEGVKISKSKSTTEIKSGVYKGWDDPRTWSLQSLVRRGIRPEAIRLFELGMGLSENNATVPVDALYAENRKIVDPEAKRFFFVGDPVGITIDKMPKIGEVEAALHPDNPKTGKRKIPVGEEIYIERADFEKFKGKEVRLLHLCNVKLDKKAKFISLENKDIQKLHWVSDNALDANVVMVDGEIKKGLAEPDFAKAKLGDVVQFERFGFVRVDSKKPLVCYYAHR